MSVEGCHRHIALQFLGLGVASGGGLETHPGQSA